MTRDLHVVVPTVGRRTCRLVVEQALAREERLARLTVVAQGGAVLGPDVQAMAARRGVACDEVVLPDAVGPAAARHIGAVRGDEEFVGFLDDDLQFATGSLSLLVERCERHGLGGACGVVDVPETSLPAVVAKTVLHRSIFRDPRPWAARSGRSSPTTLLSGGMAVYRRGLYLRCAAAWDGFDAGAIGEDAALSFAISRHAALVVDPAVRVLNLVRHQSSGPADATDRALWRLARYRSFALRHATTAGHWVAYGAVLAGVLARGLAEGAGARFSSAVLRDARLAARGVRRAAGGTRPASPPPRVVAMGDGTAGDRTVELSSSGTSTHVKGGRDG